MSLKDYESFIDRIIKNTQSEFSKVIRRLNTLIRGATAGTGQDYLDVAIATNTAESLIIEAGYTSATTNFINGAYGAAVNESAKFLKSMLGGTFRFSDESLAILQSTKETDLSKFVQIQGDLRTRLANGFSSWARGGISRDELIESLKQQGNIINDRYLKTEVDTAFAAYNQQTNLLMATDAGFTKFRYVGPSDRKTRKFCGEVLSGVYGDPVKTLEEWNKLNDVDSRSGQPDPVSVFRGGYNCRHQLVPVE